jgi:hypothetical protein
VRDKLTAYLAPSEVKGEKEAGSEKKAKAPAGNAGKAQA